MATRPGDGSSYREKVQPQPTESQTHREEREREVGMSECFLTVLVQEELVESQTAGLFADKAVDVLCAVVVDGDGVFQWLDARLKTEGNLGVADSVPKTRRHKSIICTLTHNLQLQILNCVV